MRRVVILALVLTACSQGAADPSTTVGPTAAPATTPTTAVDTTIARAGFAGLVDPLPRIPVGPGGIEYQGGDEMETTGPTSIAVGADGGIHVVDPIGRRILSFWPDGSTSSIDLVAEDVLAAPFIAAASDHLVVVEIFFGPERHRVHRMAYDGTVMSSFELPIGGRLESGLSGVLVDEEDRVHLVIQAAVEFLRLDDATFEYASLATFTKHGVGVSGDGVDVTIDGVVVTPDLLGEFGGLRLLDVAADGTVVLVREDVVSMSPITVVASVEWWSPAGVFLGSAPVDLTAQAVDAPPGLAVSPDGVVVALHALEEAVEVVALERSSNRYTG